MSNDAYLRGRNAANSADINIIKVNTGDTLTLGANLTSPTIITPVISSIVNTGTLTLPTSTDTLVGRATTDTLTNKTLTGNIAVNLVSGAATITLPTTTSTLSTLALTETLTNKTLTGNIAVNLVSGAATVTLPTTTSTLSTLALTETLTNKTLTAPVISSIVNTGTLTLPTSTDTLIGKATTDTLTNKTFDVDGTGNVLSNIANTNIKAAAAIDVNKLAALTASEIVISDGSGFISSAAVATYPSLTELTYVKGVTSAIQTQLDAKASATSVSDHLADTTDAHAGSAITNTPSGNLVATTVQAALDELQTELDGVSANSPLSSSQQLDNHSITASVAANALTIALKTQDGGDPGAGDPVKVGFRNATAATGDHTQITITGALSLVISSGSTLGHRDATSLPIYVYLINNAGTAELAASAVMFDEGTIVSTTAEGGAGAADSASVMYSTTARSNVACRMIGRLISSQTTAGTWATAISEISLVPFKSKPNKVQLNTANGYGSTNTKIRRYSTTVAYLGTAITYTDSSTDGATFTINEPGYYQITVGEVYSSASNLGISLNSSQLTTSIPSITIADRLNFFTSSAAGFQAACSWGGYLDVDDVIRSHHSGTAAATNADCHFTISKMGNL